MLCSALVSGERVQRREAVTERPEQRNPGIHESTEPGLVGLERVPGDDDGLRELVDERDDVLREAVRQTPERACQPDDDDVDVLVGTDEVEYPATVLYRGW